MKNLQLYTTADDRARLRWVLKAAGDPEETPRMGYLYAHREWGNKIRFTAYDDNRVHSTVIKNTKKAAIPLLGLALRLPDLRGYEGEDVINLEPPDVPVEPLHFGYVIGRSSAAQAAVYIPDRRAFKAAVKQAATERKSAVGRMRGIYLDLEAMTLHWPPPERGFFELPQEGVESDGATTATLVDGAYLRWGIPGGKGPMIIRQSPRSLLFETPEHTSVIMPMTEVKEGEGGDQ